MNTLKLRSISVLGLALMATMIFMSPVSADDITIKGSKADNVRIFGFKDGEVQYQKGTGSRSAQIADVDAIGLTDHPKMAQGEQALASGSANTAVRLFEQVAKDTTGEVRTLVRFRLMKAYDAKGDFRRAIRTYLLLSDAMPELAAYLPMNLPKDDKSVKDAIAEVDRLVGRAKGRDTKDSLRRLKSALESGATIQAPDRTPSGGTTSQTTRTPTGAVMNASQLNRLGTMVKDKKGQEILDLTKQLMDGMVGNFRVTESDWAAVYYYQGHGYALTGKPELAVASFMRLPIHYQDHKLVPSAMLEAAKTYATLIKDQPEKKALAQQMADAAKQAASDRKDSKLVNEANKLISSIR